MKIYEYEIMSECEYIACVTPMTGCKTLIKSAYIESARPTESENYGPLACIWNTAKRIATAVLLVIHVISLWMASVVD